MTCSDDRQDDIARFDVPNASAILHRLADKAAAVELVSRSEAESGIEGHSADRRS